MATVKIVVTAMVGNPLINGRPRVNANPEIPPLAGIP